MSCEVELININSKFVYVLNYPKLSKVKVQYLVQTMKTSRAFAIFSVEKISNLP